MIAAIDEAAIDTLVRRFYAKVREDTVIGPVFNHAITDWEEHLVKLAAFWSSVMLTTGRYKGNPMSAHLRHPIEPAMFDHWLGLWGETAREIFEPDLAAQFEAKAARIAESLKLALFFRPAALDPARPRVADP